MSDLLIHSMSEFATLILPCPDEAKASDIAEIGSEFGGMSKVLADHTSKKGGRLMCIDPEPAPGFAEWAAAEDHVHHIAKPSLDALKSCEAADAWFVDGDHNYYTVFHELERIDAIQKAAKRPLLAFLHDVRGPAHAAISTTRQTVSRPAGGTLIVLNTGCGLVKMVRIAAEVCAEKSVRSVALEAGGPRNGVLTAVEDFLKAADCEERPLLYAHVPAVLGLGIIFDAAADWSSALAEFLVPYHANPLIARLEENRLRNYLEVIDWQDRNSDAA